MKIKVFIIILSFFCFSVFAEQNNESNRKFLEAINSSMENTKKRNEHLDEYLSKYKTFNKDDYVNSDISKYEVISDSRPKVGEIFAVYMGDAMLEQRMGYYADCITPKLNIEKRLRGQVFSAKSHIFL